jgi:hypothetical protein
VGKASYGIPAVGSVPQFAGLLVGKALGTPMVAVPYQAAARRWCRICWAARCRPASCR